MPDVLLHGHLGSAGAEVENGFLVSIRVFGMVSGLVSGMVSRMVSGMVSGIRLQDFHIILGSLTESDLSELAGAK